MLLRMADAQRSINLYPVMLESGSSKSPAILKSIPGLKAFSAGTSPFRALKNVNGRLMGVAGSSLIDISNSGVRTTRGTLSSSTGKVEFEFNLNQAVLVDGSFGYTMNLSSNTFSQISSPAFYGSNTLGVLDGYAIFVRPNSGQFYISAIDDASTLDALDFATAESAPDDTIAVLVDHREVYLFGRDTTEVWTNTGATDFPLQRNNGAFIEIGTTSPYSPRKIANMLMWVGTNDHGSACVWGMQGYQPMRLSTLAIEEKLAGADLANVQAFSYTQQGSAFYVLQVPGIDTSLVYDVTNKAWHERAELVAGFFQPWRATCHAFCYGKHYVGGSDGTLYELDPATYMNGADPLCRERTSPHDALPTFERQTFNKFEVDVNAGTGGRMLMRYSNDGGITYGDWRSVSLGNVGEYTSRARYWRCGFGRDRVWQVRCTDNVPFDIVSASVA